MKKKYILLAILLFSKNAHSIDSELLQLSRKILINFEGMSLKAYRDGYIYKDNKKIINYSIGAGEAYSPNGKKVRKGDKIAKKIALNHLEQHIINIDKRLLQHDFYQKCNIRQRASCISLVYNLGYNGFFATNISNILSSYNFTFTIKPKNEDFRHIEKIRNILSINLLNSFLDTTATKNNKSLVGRRIREFQLCIRL
jgi:GH24 family phage-related lysozyme (muramidase)